MRRNHHSLPTTQFPGGLKGFCLCQVRWESPGWTCASDFIARCTRSRIVERQPLAVFQQGGLQGARRKELELSRPGSYDDWPSGVHFHLDIRRRRDGFALDRRLRATEHQTWSDGKGG